MHEGTLTNIVAIPLSDHFLPWVLFMKVFLRIKDSRKSVPYRLFVGSREKSKSIIIGVAFDSLMIIITYIVLEGFLPSRELEELK